MPPPVTLSVETPPSRPDLAMAPLRSLTLLQPHWGPARRDAPLFSKRQALPCLGAFALAVPVSYISARSTPSPPWGLCSMPPSKEAPATPSPWHSSPLTLLSQRRHTCDVTRSLGFPVPPAAHIGAQALWAHRALGCFAGYAPQMPTRTSDQQSPEWGF